MHKSIAPISLLALVAVSPAQAAPTEITACGTISQSGSYVLAQNLSVSSGNCLRIAARQVTIDLAGFTITGNGTGTGISATSDVLTGRSLAVDTTVRNGNIVGFDSGVDLSGGRDNVVEGLRVVPGFPPLFGAHGGFQVGIRADGVVKDDEVSASGNVVGIIATGTVRGNVVRSLNGIAMDLTEAHGSIVIGNTVFGVGQAPAGLSVACPANVTNNTSTGNNNGQNLVLEGQGCNNTNNVAP